MLHPDFEPRLITSGKNKGKYRDPDVDVFEDKGKSVVEPGGGTSLFDKSGVFGAAHWWYFTIPEGTTIPPSLKIRFTGTNTLFGADHYQIEPLVRMEVVAYKGALDNLARNAVEKAYRDAHH